MNPPVVPGFAGPPACPTRADGEPSSGWTWVSVVETKPATSLVSAFPTVVSVSYRCYYRPYNDVSARCGWSVAGQAVGPQGNPTVPSKTTVYPRTLTAFARGDTSQAACTRSFAVDYKSPLVAFGWYTLSTVGEQAACRWRRYTDGTAPRVLGCSAPYTLPPRTFKATLYCGGFVIGEHRRGLSFTLDDCRSGAGGGGSWSCAGGDRPTFDGMTAGPPRPAVLDDGKARAASWGPISVTGAVSGVRAQQSRLTPDPKGTPFRAGQQPGGEGQPFVAEPAAGRWTAGWRSDWMLRFFAAGDPGKPSTWTPEWRFVGDFTVTSVAITGMDPVTGQVSTTTTTTTVTGAGTCPGVPLPIDVFRARATSG